MGGADESTELWRTPLAIIYLTYVRVFFIFVEANFYSADPYFNPADIAKAFLIYLGW